MAAAHVAPTTRLLATSSAGAAAGVARCSRAAVPHLGSVLSQRPNGPAPAAHQRRPPIFSRHHRRMISTLATKELPIFPLSVVALPYSPLPLMVFEARYRVLFNTLLAGDPDVEEGLVQEDSPYAGSRRFGMCYVDEGGRLCAIGTTLEIENFIREPSGRMYVTNKGVERFKVLKVVQERPVLLCEVEVLPEDEDASDEAKALADEVAELFRNVFQLHFKMVRMRTGGGSSASSGGGLGSESAAAAAAAAAAASSGASGGDASESIDETMAAAAELTDYTPQQLSYWVAHAFTDSKYTQQALLEENSTLTRLTEEKRLLEKTLMYYRAATAVEGVFGRGGSSGGGDSGSSSSSGASGSPGSGGGSPGSDAGGSGSSASAKPSEAPQPPAGGPD